MTHVRVRVLALLVSALLAASLLTTTGPMPAAAAEDDPAPAPARAAEAALERVQELLAGKPGHQRSHAPGPHDDRGDLTLALRDLFVTKQHLRGEHLREAEQILARPTNNDPWAPAEEPWYGSRNVKRKCSASVCVHFVRGGKHAAAPAYAKKVLAAATRSNRVATGRLDFRRPLRDPKSAAYGGNRRPDIYLGNLPSGLFGYAMPEATYVTGGERAAFGYVVIDNDYRGQCRTYYERCAPKHRRALMRATTAHEYFHLIQFGYDVAEDGWFMEATATWIEDEIFGGVNDNVNFLYAVPSALQTPQVPLDSPHASPYGNWIYFRHLSEKFGRTVISDAWRRADAWLGNDGSRDPENLYSIQATREAVEASGGNWNRDFATFADGNRRTHRHYAEGHRYPNAPRSGRVILRKGKLQAFPGYHLSRLASATHRIRPNKSLRRGWQLRVVVEGNPAERGGYALATIRRKNGNWQQVELPLGDDGRTVTELPFGRAKVRWIEITLVNASTRYECDLDKPDHTCEGRALDNDQRQKLKLRAVRG